MTEHQPVLLVEDDRLDTLRFKRALRDLGISMPVRYESTFDNALRYLALHFYAAPSLIVLDLNGPGMNGIEFMRVLKTQRRWNDIPVIVLTSSDLMADRMACHSLKAVAYFTKAMAYPDYMQTVDLIYRYWAIREGLDSNQ